MSAPRSYPVWKSLLWFLACLAGLPLGLIPAVLIGWAWDHHEKAFNRKAKAEFEKFREPY